MGAGGPGGMSMPDINSPEVQEQLSAKLGMLLSQAWRSVLIVTCKTHESAQSFQNPRRFNKPSWTAAPIR